MVRTPCRFSVASLHALAHTELMENVKLTTKSGNVVVVSGRVDDRIADVETFSDDDCGNVVVVTAKSNRAANDLVGEYRAWGLEVIEVEHTSIVLAA